MQNDESTQTIEIHVEGYDPYNSADTKRVDGVVAPMDWSVYERLIKRQAT